MVGRCSPSFYWQRKGERTLGCYGKYHWQIWNGRNKEFFEEDKDIFMHLVQRAITEWLEFTEAQMVEEQESMVETNDVQSGREWKAPQFGFVKVNTDRVVKREERRIGRVGITRNTQGRILKCWAIGT
ncbi:hypothetical protein ACH5RR_018419 [Cinchona calisaya]|uniref:Uncharacterized protein n=1 Tax=Cinchona calisaya TaxID=153742 RepID=A0ABD2ZPI6_9GENT